MSIIFYYMLSVFPTQKMSADWGPMRASDHALATMCDSVVIFRSLSLDPRERHTVWGLTIGWSIYWSCRYGLSQASVQRFSAAKSMKEARL